MSAPITALKNGAIIASIGAPGWAWKLRTLRAQVMCATAQLRALEVDDEDAAQAVRRVLVAVGGQLDNMAAELDYTGPRKVQS